jgi:hypothetical protein
MNIRSRVDRLAGLLDEQQSQSAAKPGFDPTKAMRRRALGRLSTEDLYALRDAVKEGKQESEWSERESSAVKTFICLFEEEVQTAGHR